MKTNRFLLLALLLLGVSAAGSAEIVGLKPLRGLLIMLDPGHGGQDPGAVGPTGLKESEVNLRVGRYLRQLLIADGAQVIMTRDDDRSVSLAQRVEIAARVKPDLFVSIHHNASLRPVSENRSEIYFNALDQGVPLRTAEEMAQGLQQVGYGDRTVMLPGGFFVLRNNPAPAILTEGAYITIPHIEQALRTGKYLTDQAQVYRLAIRRAFEMGPVRVELMAGEVPLRINTPFFNLLFGANKALEHVHLKTDPGAMPPALALNRVPVFGHHYSLVNTQPVTSGRYDLGLRFHAQDGSISAIQTIPLIIELPLANTHVVPVAPFIPVGFTGKFPLLVSLQDDWNRPNTRSVVLTVRYGDQEMQVVSDSDGRSVVELDLDGHERGPLPIEIHAEGRLLTRAELPILEPQRIFVLGRVVRAAGDRSDPTLVPTGLERVKIAAGGGIQAQTSLGGYFFFEMPVIFRNMRLDLAPPLGYVPEQHWIRTAGETVVQPVVSLTPPYPRLLGKTIGLIAPRALDGFVRPLVKKLLAAGAQIVRLTFPEHLETPVHQAVAHANSIPNLALVLSFKKLDLPGVTLRHYHRGGTGKNLALAASRLLAEPKPDRLPIQAKVEVASDYEINHTQATAVAVAVPHLAPPGLEEALAPALVAAAGEVLPE
jgi:N-acetylmuramoyl-L-alanine amidase